MRENNPMHSKRQQADRWLDAYRDADFANPFDASGKTPLGMHHRDLRVNRPGGLVERRA
jgi:hypothetical protein